MHLMLHADFLEYNVPLMLARLPYSSKVPNFYKINGDLNSRKQFAGCMKINENLAASTVVDRMVEKIFSSGTN